MQEPPTASPPALTMSHIQSQLNPNWRYETRQDLNRCPLLPCTCRGPQYC